MSSIVSILRQADIFYELTPTQLELIASIGLEKHFQHGELIFGENTEGTELYVIASGEVEIELDPSLVGHQPSDSVFVVAKLGRGQSFGEIALVDEGKRSAGARAASHDTRLIVIPRDKLMLLCDTYPQLGYRLMRNLAVDLAMKIRTADLNIREKLYWQSRPKDLT